jgi:hypothetical protein
MTGFIFHFFQISVLVVLSVQDLKSKTISLGWVGLLGLTTLVWTGLYGIPEHLLWPLGMTALVIAARLGLTFYKKQVPVGWADVALVFILLLPLTLWEYPLFMVLTGAGGLLTAWFWKEKTFPLVPALSIAYTLCLLLRLVK